MKVSERQWMFGGAALLVGVSAVTRLTGFPTIWVPMPLPLVIAMFAFAYWGLLVIPALYTLELVCLRRSQRLPIAILGLVVFVGLLNAVYFWLAWQDGVMYQGEAHTKIVAGENLVGFGIALAVAMIAVKKQSASAAFSANLLLFVLLSWCAFPYLGELP